MLSLQILPEMLKGYISAKERRLSMNVKVQKYMEKTMLFYEKTILMRKDINRIGNVSMNAVREISQINRKGKLTGCLL